MKQMRSSSSSSSTPGKRLVEYFVVVSSLPKRHQTPKTKNTTNTHTPSSTRPVTPLSPNVSFESQFSAEETPQNISIEDMHELYDEGALSFEPVVTARYPTTDHNGNPLHQSVACFCHPAGIITLKSKPSMPKIHYFVMTGGRGAQMYGVCLTVHEPFSVKIRNNQSSSSSSTSKPQSPDDDTNSDDDNSTSSNTTSTQTLDMYIPKCICILSRYPYLVAFREYLTQLDRLLRTTSLPIPIERYIVNFCSEVPAPPPGSFEVQTTINDSIIKIWSPPHNQPIPWVSLPFRHLFECLDIPNIITAWHCLALERQILVVSTQLTLLTTVCEILTSLLFPMTWSHAYIPLLPRFLCPILNAPMSFLIGLDKQYLNEALTHLSGECILIDLDTNQIQMGPSTPPLPKLPPTMKNLLSLKLHENAGMVFREARSLRKDDDFSDRGQHLLPHVKVMADACWESKLCLFDEAFHLAFTPEQRRNGDFLNGNDGSGMEYGDGYNNGSVGHDQSFYLLQAVKDKYKKQSRWDAVQEAFLRIYIEMLCVYRKCLVFPSKDDNHHHHHSNGNSNSNGSEYSSNDGSSAGSGYGGAGFRSREFIKSHRYDKRAFLTELIKTQMFDEFVTKRLYGVSAADISFFDQAIDRFNKRTTNMTNVTTIDTSIHMVGSHSPNGSPTNGIVEGAHRPSSAPNGVGKGASVRRFMNRFHSGNVVTFVSNEEPLLQSARVRRKLKTIVPPEPSADGLVMKNEDGEEEDGDDELDNIGYAYANFPTKFDRQLFCPPRPLPPAVLAEFDRQQDDAAQFRRRMKRQLSKRPGGGDKHDSSPEVTTFTVFLVAFTAMIGKDLVELSTNHHLCEDERQILATYTIDSAMDDDSDADADADAGEEGESKLVEKQDTNDSDSFHVERERFTNPLSEARMEEAKASAAAQLNLAFDILDIMRERELKTDPVAYKCLIDACGRCGDTERATNLLRRMHQDGIVADAVVYSCLVSAFSVESTYGNLTNKGADIPEWANGASAELNWNNYQSRSFYNFRGGGQGSNDGAPDFSGIRSRLAKYIDRRRNNDESEEEEPKTINAAAILGDEPVKEKFVTPVIANQIGFGENLLELVYPDISIDTNNERCPKCDTMMLDDEVVAGWTPDPQDYTTQCRTCKTKFVPKFRVQSASQTFIGSKGAGTPLICERLSPWVLEKELRTKMHDITGAEDLLDPAWREKENKNSVLWWNLILSFMRYRLPFTFLLQGSFPQDLISPLPSMDMAEETTSEEEMKSDTEEL